MMKVHVPVLTNKKFILTILPNKFMSDKPSVYKISKLVKTIKKPSSINLEDKREAYRLSNLLDEFTFIT